MVGCESLVLVWAPARVCVCLHILPGEKPLSAQAAGSQCCDEGRGFRDPSTGSFSSPRAQTACGPWPEAVALLYVTIKCPSGICGLGLR